MRWIRLFFRIFGWLLTPFLAWAASFFGAVAGALLAIKLDDPVRGLVVTAVCGGLAGVAALIGWLHYLRRAPEGGGGIAGAGEGAPGTTGVTRGPGVPDEVNEGAAAEASRPR